MSFKGIIEFQNTAHVGKLQLVYLTCDIIVMVMTSPFPGAIKNQAQLHRTLYLLVNLSYCSQINSVAKVLVPLV